MLKSKRLVRMAARQPEVAKTAAQSSPTSRKTVFTYVASILLNCCIRFYPGSNEQHRLFGRLLKTYLFARY